jgi:signal transduction histidine kinase
MKSKSWDVLLVEDLPIYISVMRSILANSGIHLDTAKTLKEGVDKVQNDRYDAVLLDLGLPDSRGLDTFNTFKSSCISVPIIIFSGTGDEEIALQAMQNGAQDYLLKGAYLTNEDGGSLLITRSIAYAIERHHIQQELLQERKKLELRVIERTQDLQKLASWLVSAQEDERRRISLELHDEAGQTLTALSLKLKLLQKELEEVSETHAEQLQEASQLTDSINSRLRSLAHNLRPPAIDAVGLNQALFDLCNRIARQTGIEILYSGTDILDQPNHVQISLYRTVQEALTNTVKHAKASKIKVSLNSDAEHLTLQVEDDGCGFSVPQNPTMKTMGGIGLLGIHDRIEAVGGRLSIQSNPGLGTTISVLIPQGEPV